VRFTDPEMDSSKKYSGSITAGYIGNPPSSEAGMKLPASRFRNMILKRPGTDSPLSLARLALGALGTPYASETSRDTAERCLA